LVAIDLKTGQKKWDVPLGSMTSILTPDVAAQTRPDWGSVNLGGAVAAGDGVVFAGGALDRRLHAYDIETGRELWSGELPASAKATPMVYRIDSGAEHVAIAVGGGGAWGAGDYIIAFRVAPTPPSKP
jgi:quinoprotein glucose dehydrogenase